MCHLPLGTSVSIRNLISAQELTFVLHCQLQWRDLLTECHFFLWWLILELRHVCLKALVQRSSWRTFKPNSGFIYDTYLGTGLDVNNCEVVHSLYLYFSLLVALSLPTPDFAPSTQTWHAPSVSQFPGHVTSFGGPSPFSLVRGQEIHILTYIQVLRSKMFQCICTLLVYFLVWT